VLVQAQRLTGGARKLVGVTEVTGMEGDVITMQDIFTFEQLGVHANGGAFGQFLATGIRPSFLDRLKTSGCALDPETFTRKVLMTDDGE
jgi:pilus assembly protein CpaF